MALNLADSVSTKKLDSVGHPFVLECSSARHHSEELHQLNYPLVLKITLTRRGPRIDDSLVCLLTHNPCFLGGGIIDNCSKDSDICLPSNIRPHKDQGTSSRVIHDSWRRRLNASLCLRNPLIQPSFKRTSVLIKHLGNLWYTCLSSLPVQKPGAEIKSPMRA